MRASPGGLPMSRKLREGTADPREVGQQSAFPLSATEIDP